MQEINKLREELASLRRYCEKSSKQAHDYRILTTKQIETLKTTSDIYKETLKELAIFDPPINWSFERLNEYINDKASAALMINKPFEDKPKSQDMTHLYYTNWFSSQTT